MRLLGTLIRVAATPIAVVLSLLAGAVLIALIGESPFEIYALMLQDTLGTGYGLGQTLFEATPLIFTGLAVAVGFRAGLFNIGAEGQIVLGAFSAAMFGAWAARAATSGANPSAGMSPAVLVTLALLAAAAAGAVWGAIPGVLKARFGAHEVINTIMLNFIAAGLVAFIGGYVFEPATVRTAPIAVAAELPRLERWWPILRGSPANAALFIALGAALCVWLLLFRTKLGFELRAVGLSPLAAEAGGISIGRIQVIALMLSGALAGLGGSNFVLGYKHAFELGFSAGVGFMGIAVALIGRNHPFGVILAALFFGALDHGGLVINARVSRELVTTLQGIVILTAICTQQVMERLARRFG